MDIKESKISELTLLLIYLTGWKEDNPETGGKKVRTWRGYPFKILDKMEAAHLITQYANSVVLTAKGTEKAIELKKKYEKARRGK